MNFMELCRTRHRPIYIQDLEKTFQSWETPQEHGAQVTYPSHRDPFARTNSSRLVEAEALETDNLQPELGDEPLRVSVEDRHRLPGLMLSATTRCAE